MNLPPAIWLFVGMAVVLILPCLWNHFARRYNHKLLASSKCSACGAVLGPDCIAPARAMWNEEVQAVRAQGLTRVMRSNLELKCPHCGRINYERDLYVEWKRRR